MVLIITSFKVVNTWQNSRNYCIFLSVYSKDKRDKVIKDIKRDKRDNEKGGRGMTLWIMYERDVCYEM